MSFVDVELETELFPKQDGTTFLRLVHVKQERQERFAVVPTLDVANSNPPYEIVSQLLTARPEQDRSV